MGRKRKDIKDFILEAQKIHANKYDYSESVYLGANKKIKIVCPVHGEFKQNPNVHIRNHGCPSCGREKFKESISLNLDMFILKSNEIHKNKYDYSKTKFNNTKDVTTIICPIHGEFEQVVRYHLDGNGCKNCHYDFIRTNIDDFIKKSNTIHSNKYNYSLSQYKNNSTTITIICPIHGEFEQTPQNHLNACGCPSCKESKGEKKLCKILEKKGIDYVRQKKFNDCRRKRKLPFDFYLPKENILIEYDGQQHFNIVEYFGGKEAFDSIKECDSIKDSFAKKNNIKLIRIPYYDFYDMEFIINSGLKITY